MSTHWLKGKRDGEVVHGNIDSLLPRSVLQTVLTLFSFQEVSNAFKVLSDPDERAYYDRYGEQRQAGSRPRGPGGQSMGGAHADELTPEDIFNMFFGVPPGGRGRRASDLHRRRQQHDVNGAGNMNLIQVLPLVLLMLFSLLSSLSLGDEKPFALKRGGGYDIERQTRHRKQYWVRDLLLTPSPEIPGPV